MKTKVKIIFGKEQVDKLLNEQAFSESEKELNIKEYYFKTKAEKKAFCQGINEAVGWMECYLIE